MNEIVRFYQESSEAERLFHGSGLLERARTQEILGRYLPKPPARILDVGGGPGVYAGWLAGLGYNVSLIDPVTKHLEEASRYPLAGIEQGDARALPSEASSVDALLLLGPLYHLREPAARAQALREAHRVLKPGSYVFASAISRWASLLHSLVDGFLDDDEFWPILQYDLNEGIHFNHTGNPRYFTTAAFHTPAELRAELTAAGFQQVSVLAIEGPCWLAKDFDARWQDPPRRERLLALARQVEQAEALQGASLHLLAIGRKP